MVLNNWNSMNSRRSRLSAFLGVCFLTFVFCNGPELAGGTNLPNQVVGKIISSDNAGAKNIRVALVKYASDAEEIKTVDITRTDSSGRYSFSGMDTGVYLIEALADDSSSVALRKGVKVSDTLTPDLCDTLKKSGSLSAVVKAALPPNSLCFGWIYSTPYTVPVDPSGNLDFKVVPPGSHKVLVIARTLPSAPAGVVISQTETQVTEGSNVQVDTLRVHSPSPSSGVLLIDDFNAGSIHNHLGHGWWTFNDVQDGGNSVIEPFGSLNGFFAEPGAGDTGKCAHISFTFGSASSGPRHVGCGFRFAQFGAHTGTADISGAKRLELAAKGYGTNASVRLRADLLDIELHLEMDLLSAEWKEYSFDLDSAAAAYSPDLTWSEMGRFINELLILNTSDIPNVSGELWVDDIQLIY